GLLAGAGGGGGWGRGQAGSGWPPHPDQRPTRGDPVTALSVIHDTFTIERTYPAAPSQVFAAFASAEAKNIWGDTGGLEPAGGEAGIAEFDFRAGGRERFGFKMNGTTYRYDARYYDIVPDQR